jgi:hypothetical protein
MGIAAFYAEKISPLLGATSFGRRLDMAAIAFNADLQFAASEYSDSGGRIFTDAELEEIFSGLDPASLALARKFMRRQYRCPRNGFMVHPKYFYDDAEKSEYRKIAPELRRLRRRLHLPVSVGPESLYYHHGLRFAPDFVKRRIAGRVFADIGGWCGDSALVFGNYDPARILIFEPIAANREKLLRNLARNRVRPGLCEVVPFGLSDRASVENGMECRTLDSFAAASAPFGVLKADIEGMGLKFLRGAEATIRRDRPLLSLSIYHNEEEFTGIFRTIKEWKIAYHCEIRQFSPYAMHGEYSLFAYPEEWRAADAGGA